MFDRRPVFVRAARLALVLVGSGACFGYDAGIEIAIELHVAPPTLRVPMGEGFATLTDARLRVASVELVPCESIPSRGASSVAASSIGMSASSIGTSGTNASRVDGATSSVRELREVWLSRAFAHELDTSGPARTVDARHTSGTFAGWLLRPTPGRYCALRVHLEPSDDVPSFALVGEADVPFTTIVDGPLDVELPIALTLETPEDGRTIAIEVDPACWLAGGVPSEAELAARLAGCL